MSELTGSQPPWPLPDRVRPGRRLDERATLEAFLDQHRQTLLAICSGLSAEQLVQRAAPPSTMSLLGLLRHLTNVERHWFERVLDRQDVPEVYGDDQNVDGDFDDTDPATAGADRDRYLAELALVRAIAARYQLDDLGHWPRVGVDLDLRWIYLHLIEEYARHNGHADLLREAIDGSTAS
jgi:uncharacterized damage-inducible protein DinB